MLWVYLDGNHEKGGCPQQLAPLPLGCTDTFRGAVWISEGCPTRGGAGQLADPSFPRNLRGTEEAPEVLQAPWRPHGKGLQGHGGAFWLVLAVWAWLGGGPRGRGHEREGSAGAPHVGSRVHSQEMSPGHPETKVPGGKCPGVNPEHPGPHGGVGSSQRGEFRGPLNVLTPLLQKKGGVSGWGRCLHHPSR